MAFAAQLVDINGNTFKKMELFVKRRWKKPTYTIGELYVDGVRLFNTLEDKDRGLTQSTPTTEIYKKKVYGQTAIGTGRYRVNLDTVSPKFKSRSWAVKYGGRVPWIEGVPGFDRILIHPGTTPNDTAGCILIGENKQKGKVLNSQRAFFDLMDFYLEPARERKEEVWITIE